jgi:hypothetical protein
MQTGALFLGTIGLGVSGYLWSSGAEKINSCTDYDADVMDEDLLSDLKSDLKLVDIVHDNTYAPQLEKIKKKCSKELFHRFIYGILSKAWLADKTIEEKIKKNETLSWGETMLFLESRLVEKYKKEARVRVARAMASHTYYVTYSNPYEIASCSRSSDSGFQKLEFKSFKEQITHFSDKVIPKVEQDIKACRKAGFSQQNWALGLGAISAAAVGGVLAYDRLY